ncbi:GFA family protein [Pantoea sp. KXB25]|uniref:GFA family protein n=2 Tax=unclassified Pantoea TaxID=2630326 RepID=UPI003AB8EE08
MKGSCLCKKIQYECDVMEEGILNCHCHTCRKAHAAPYVPAAGVKREHFRWLKGSEYLSSYASSPDKLRHLCSLCGSNLMAERPHQGHVIVRVATLDEPPFSAAISYIWCSHDAPWLSEIQDTPYYAQWQKADD